jgi:hypothetical protein
MELVEREYGRFFTATGQEARILRDCRAALDAAKSAAKDALIARQRQEQTATALAENRRELADLELRLGTAKHDADVERIRADAASAASGRVAVAQGNLEIARQRVVSAEALLNTRIEVDAAIDRLNSEFAALDLSLARRLSGQGDLETALQSAESALAAADGLVRAARAELDTAQREQKRQGLAASREALIDKIKRLEQLEAATQQARSTRAGLPSMDAKALAHLKTLDRELRSAVAQLQGAAVRVVVHVHESVSVDGAQRSAGERVQIDIVEDRRVAIGGIAEVEIRPGGGELERLRQARMTADSTLASALKVLNATDLDDASSIHEQILELDRLIADLGRQAQATTAKQLSELCEDLLRIDADLIRLGPEQRISSTEAELSASLAALDATLTKDRSTRDAASGSLAEFRSGTAALAAKAETTRAEHQRLARLYAERPTAAELRSGHTLAVAERQNAQSSLAIAQEEFSDLGGAGVQEDARRLELSAEALANRVRASRSTGDQLRGALNGMMEAGNYETVEQSEALVEQSQMQWQRLRQQADAAQRLWQVLGDSRQRVIERLTAPVTERVRPYLREIFPGSTLDAGDGFDVMGLQSGNLREPFTELSGGAQEQISLLARIGIAEVLAGEGTLPLILDDVLINTDPERIRRMHRALFRASERLQIMVFSCHDVLFDGLGAEFVVKLDRGRH